MGSQLGRATRRRSLVEGTVLSVSARPVDELWSADAVVAFGSLVTSPPRAAVSTMNSNANVSTLAGSDAHTRAMAAAEKRSLCRLVEMEDAE